MGTGVKAGPTINKFTSTLYLEAHDNREKYRKETQTNYFRYFHTYTVVSDMVVSCQSQKPINTGEQCS